MKRPSNIIYTVLQIFVTAFAWFSGVWTFRTDRNPFDIVAQYHSNPTEIAWLIMVCASVMTVCSVLMILYLGDAKWRKATNWAALLSWIAALSVFIYGTSASGIEWLYFLIITVPPFLCWLATGPNIQVQGDQW